MISKKQLTCDLLKTMEGAGEPLGALYLSEKLDVPSATIGRQLLDFAHRQFPAQEFWLEVRESNAPAIALYQSEGYAQAGFRKRYYHNPEEGAVLMTRTVKRNGEEKDADIRN